MYNPLLEAIGELLARGVAAGVFRKGIDAVDLYISITSLSAHFVSHQYTFEAIFQRRLMTPPRMKQRLEHAADMVIRYLLADQAGGTDGKSVARPTTVTRRISAKCRPGAD
jgi:TetR/AcrR family transcriptional regulator